MGNSPLSWVPTDLPTAEPGSLTRTEPLPKPVSTSPTFYSTVAENHQRGWDFNPTILSLELVARNLLSFSGKNTPVGGYHPRKQFASRVY